jgi:hypothetical protein
MGQTIPYDEWVDEISMTTSWLPCEQQGSGIINALCLWCVSHNWGDDHYLVSADIYTIHKHEFTFVHVGGMLFISTPSRCVTFVTVDQHATSNRCSKELLLAVWHVICLNCMGQNPRCPKFDGLNSICSNGI